MLEELVVFGVALAHGLDVDLLLVANVEHDVAVLLVLLYLLVRRLASVRYCHTRRLEIEGTIGKKKKNGT